MRSSTLRYARDEKPDKLAPDRPRLSLRAPALVGALLLVEPGAAGHTKCESRVSVCRDVATAHFTAVGADRILVRMGLRDVLSELEALERAGVVPRFAIGGAVGATRYIEPAATEDVDVFVAFPDATAPSLAPLGPIYQFLSARGARVEGAHLVIGDWPVLFLPADDPLLAEALADANREMVDGIGTWIFSAEHLAAIALALGRAKDRLRVLQFVEAEALDMRVFTDILARHGLTGRWDDFARTMLGDG